MLISKTLSPPSTSLIVSYTPFVVKNCKVYISGGYFHSKYILLTVRGNVKKTLNQFSSYSGADSQYVVGYPSTACLGKYYQSLKLPPDIAGNSIATSSNTSESFSYIRHFPGSEIGSIFPLLSKIHFYDPIPKQGFVQVLFFS